VNVLSEIRAEVKRKLIHMIPGFLAIPVVVWIGNPIATLIAAFFLAIYSIHEAKLRLGLKFDVPIASQTFKVMARREELEKGYFTGAVYFWACTLAIVAIMEPVRAAAAVMVSSFGDAAAAIMGKAIPLVKLPYNPSKSLGGFLGMLVMSALSCLVAGIPITVSLVVAAVSALVESLTRVSVLDELTVPVVAALLLQLY